MAGENSTFDDTHVLQFSPSARLREEEWVKDAVYVLNSTT